MTHNEHIRLNLHKVWNENKTILYYSDFTCEEPWQLLKDV